MHRDFVTEGRFDIVVGPQVHDALFTVNKDRVAVQRLGRYAARVDHKRDRPWNVFAVAGLTQAIDSKLEKGAHVLGISSMGGVQGSAKFPGLSAYSSSKGALITLFELLAEEYKTREVCFNSLALGAVQTEMLEAAFPGLKAPVSAKQMGAYVADFVQHGHQYYNGKVLPVSSSTP